VPASAPEPAVTRAGEDLLSRWSESHRYYHTRDHLASVLSVVDGYADRVPDPDAVRLAAWFHDAVYDPMRLDNEEVSARLAESVLPDLTVAPERVSEVARLVRLTASHDPHPGDHHGELITDADLSILAADGAVYRAYTMAVRREYAHVPDAAFAAGRAAVLHNLLDLPSLFHTPALREHWEERARRNLAGELAALRNNPPPGVDEGSSVVTH
jgi:predicted metal-dependent HD superfamily phosphohydrolase